MAEITYEIIQNIGTLSESKRGWRKELNLISWSGRAPKYDIRDWAPEHVQMGKGITLTEEELRELGDLISLEIRRENSGDTASSSPTPKPSKKEKAQKAFAPKTIQPKIPVPQKSEPDISGAVNFDDM